MMNKIIIPLFMLFFICSCKEQMTSNEIPQPTSLTIKGIKLLDFVPVNNDNERWDNDSGPDIVFSFFIEDAMAQPLYSDTIFNAREMTEHNLFDTLNIVLDDPGATIWMQAFDIDDPSTDLFPNEKMLDQSGVLIRSASASTSKVFQFPVKTEWIYELAF